jgi:putative hydrolase of the HAD superfamily
MPNDCKISTARLRGVVFDLDGTLYHQARVRRDMLFLLMREALSGTMGFPPVKALRVLYAFRRIREGLRTLPPGHGVESLQYVKTAEATGVKEGFVRDVVRSFIHEKPLPVLERLADGRVRAALEGIKMSGLKLGVYSDYPAVRKLDALGLGDGLFDIVVDSEMPEVDAFKPNPRGFVYAAEMLGISPSEALYVGDRVRVDMEGAARAGMQCALVTWSNRSAAPGSRYMLVRDAASLAGLLEGVR